MVTALTVPVCDRMPELAQRRADGRNVKDPRVAREVPPGECWAFTDHRTMAEIIAEGLL
jgi:hypothetical protein